MSVSLTAIWPHVIKLGLGCEEEKKKDRVNMQQLTRMKNSKWFKLNLLVSSIFSVSAFQPLPSYIIKG